MKTIPFFILFIFCALKLQAQNCSLSYSSNPGSTVIQFSPDTAYSPNIYHFAWDFGDGNSSTSAFPTHSYNVTLPVLACCNIYDAANTLICSACDSIRLPSATSCNFIVSNPGVGQAWVGCQTYFPTPVGVISTWDYGDGFTTTGDVVSHIYSAVGTYNICLTQTDSITGAVICSTCQLAVVQYNPNYCSFTYYNNPLTPSTFDFTANVPGGTIVNWSFGDNTTGTGSNISHTFTTVDSFMVCMNASPCALYCVWITNGTPPPYCNFNASPDPLNNFAYNFYIHNYNPGTSVVWDFGDGTTGTDTTASHVYSLPGFYQVCVSEVNTNGAVVCSHCDSIYAGPVTHCNFTFALNPQNNLSVNFTANVTGPANSITWDFGDNTTGSGPNPSHTYANPGSYHVCIAVGNTGTIVCNSCHQLWAGGNNGTCVLNFAPDSVHSNGFNFTFPPSSNSSEVVWDFGDGGVDTGANVTHIYTTPGIYNACATERDSMGVILCHSCVYVTANGVTNNCQASFISSSQGLDAFFIDLSNTNLNATNYNWSFGDGGISASRFPQHTYALPGTYNVCLMIFSGSCTDQFCSSIVVDTLSNPAGGCQAFYAFVQLAPYQVSVVNLSSGQNLSYFWDFGDNTVDTSMYPSHYYQTIGSYNLCLTISDPNGCSNTYCDTLSVDTIGNIFRTLQGFTVNVLSPSQLTGVKEIDQPSTFKAFPNPVNSELHLSLSTTGKDASAYRVLSIQGAEIFSGPLSGKEGVVNVQALSAGIYLFEVILTDGTKSFLNIVKD